MSSSDVDLVRAARRGDASAAGALFDRHWQAMWRVALAYTGRPELADEAAQDGFARAFAALDRFDESRSFFAWLRTIVTRAALDAWRRECRHARHAQEASDDADEESVAEGDADVRLVRGALLELSPERRTVLVLRFWFDYDLSRIAEVLDVPVGTVSSRLVRGLADLRGLLEVTHHG